jgi:hypothetical protein
MVGRIAFVWYLLGSAGVVVAGILSRWKAAVIYALAYLAVFVPAA